MEAYYGAAAHIGTRGHPGSLPLVLAAATVCAALEIWLARREKRWPGLLLPGAAFLWALAEVVSAFAGLWQRSAGALGLALLMLLWCSVPALALLAVYAACRTLWKRKRRRERDKMDISDI